MVSSESNNNTATSRHTPHGYVKRLLYPNHSAQFIRKVKARDEVNRRNESHGHKCPTPASISQEISNHVEKTPESADSSFAKKTAKNLARTCDPHSTQAIVNKIPVNGRRALTIKKAILYFIGLGVTVGMTLGVGAEWGANGYTHGAFKRQRL